MSVFYRCVIYEVIWSNVSTWLNLENLAFPIVKFDYFYNNKPSSPAIWVFVSQMLQYARTCSMYDQFLKRAKLLTNKQNFQQYRLKSSFSMVDTTTQSSGCWLTYFIPIVSLVLFTEFPDNDKEHWSAEDAYFSMASNPTSNFCS